MKKLTTLLLLTLLPLLASAQNAEVNGIYYHLNAETKQAEVTSVSTEYKGVMSIPEKVWYEKEAYNVTSIGSNAFSGCSELTSVTISNNITSIGENIFSGCTGLKEITCFADKVPTAHSNAFKDFDLANASLYVFEEKADSYKNSAPWNGFGKIFPMKKAALSDLSLLLSNPMKIKKSSPHLHKNK